MHSASSTCVILAGLVLPLMTFAAGAQSVDKSSYNLFNPVPDDQLRPLSSEAYDAFPDARTLDAGHFQVESELINYFYFSDNQFNGHITENEFAWSPRITVGLLNQVDFFVRPSYELSYFKINNGGQETTGHFNEFQNTTTGFKINLWGNDAGTTALAIRPYLVLPTSESVGYSGDVLGGADLALLVRLAHGWSVKFDSEFFATELPNIDGYSLFAGFDNSMSINKTLCSKADAYWYLNTAVTSNPSAPWNGYTGFGLDYNFTGNIQLFAGIGFGLNTSADLYNPRLGFVWRF